MTPAMKNEIVAAKRSKTSSHRFYDGKAEESVGVFG
jgi:hypothetical protein